MQDLPRYNAVFMLSQSHAYDEVVKHLALLENATHQRGVWDFRNQTQERGHVVMHEGQIECMYEALADLIIISVRPLGSSLTENFGGRRGGYSKQRLFQENNMTS